MYNKVSRCLKTTGSEHSVCTILSGHLYVFLPTIVVSKTVLKSVSVVVVVYVPDAE